LNYYFSQIKILIKRFSNFRIRSALTYGTASVITQTLMMVYIVVIAQWLGADRYGFIAPVYAAALLTSFLFNWGINEWMMKVGAKKIQPEILGGSAIKFKGSIGLIWVVCLWMTLRIVRPELYLSDILIVIILDVWFDSVFGTILIILILTARVEWASGLLIASRVFRLFFALILILTGTKSILIFSLSRFGCTILMVMIAWWKAKPVFSVKGSLKPGRLFIQSADFNSSELLNLIFLHADVNILSLLGANRVLIANYSLVMGLFNAVMSFPSGVYNILLPYSVREYSENRSRFFKKLRSVYIGFTVLGLFIWVSLAILEGPISTFFISAGYQNFSRLLVYLSPLLFLRTINQANITYLVSVGWQAKRIIPQGMAVLTKSILGVWAVSHWQHNGMVVVSLAAEFGLLVGFFIQSIRHFYKSRRLFYE